MFKRNISISFLIPCIILFLLIGLVIFHKAAGMAIWRVAHAPTIALLLHRDAALALTIGNYYFNGEKNGVYDLNKASFYFNKALEIDPRVPDAWHQLARIDFLRGDFVHALQKINTQIELHGSSFMASFYIRGLVNGFLGRFADAESDFKMFLTWDTTNWAVHNDLAWIYFSKGDYRNTELIAAKGLAYNPNNPWLLTSLGLALLNQNKKAEAHVLLAQALEESKKLTTENWSHAYPGNDPAIAKSGLKKMQEVIAQNLEKAK